MSDDTVVEGVPPPLPDPESFTNSEEFHSRDGADNELNGSGALVYESGSSTMEAGVVNSENVRTVPHGDDDQVGEDCDTLDDNYDNDDHHHDHDDDDDDDDDDDNGADSDDLYGDLDTEMPTTTSQTFYDDRNDDQDRTLTHDDPGNDLMGNNNEPMMSRSHNDDDERAGDDGPVSTDNNRSRSRSRSRSSDSRSDDSDTEIENGPADHEQSLDVKVARNGVTHDTHDDDEGAEPDEGAAREKNATPASMEDGELMEDGEIEDDDDGANSALQEEGKITAEASNDKPGSRSATPGHEDSLDEEQLAGMSKRARKRYRKRKREEREKAEAEKDAEGQEKEAKRKHKRRHRHLSGSPEDKKRKKSPDYGCDEDRNYEYDQYLDDENAAAGDEGSPSMVDYDVYYDDYSDDSDDFYDQMESEPADGSLASLFSEYMDKDGNIRLDMPDRRRARRERMRFLGRGRGRGMPADILALAKHGGMAVPRRKGEVKGSRPRRDEDPICKVYKETGDCKLGIECPFSHDCLRTEEKRQEVCKFYLMDTCAKGDRCTYLHSELPCKYWHTGYICHAGENCKYSHDKLTEDGKALLKKVLREKPLGPNPGPKREGWVSDDEETVIVKPSKDHHRRTHRDHETKEHRDRDKEHKDREKEHKDRSKDKSKDKHKDRDRGKDHKSKDKSKDRAKDRDKDRSSDKSKDKGHDKEDEKIREGEGIEPDKERRDSQDSTASHEREALDSKESMDSKEGEKEEEPRVSKERECKDGESKEREPGDRESKERESKDRESYDRESKDRESYDRESKDRESKDRDRESKDRDKSERKDRKDRDKDRKDRDKDKDRNKDRDRRDRDRHRDKDKDRSDRSDRKRDRDRERDRDRDERHDDKKPKRDGLLGIGPDDSRVPSLMDIRVFPDASPPRGRGGRERRGGRDREWRGRERGRGRGRGRMTYEAPYDGPPPPFDMPFDVPFDGQIPPYDLGRPFDLPPLGPLGPPPGQWPPEIGPGPGPSGQPGNLPIPFDLPGLPAGSVPPDMISVMASAIASAIRGSAPNQQAHEDNPYSQEKIAAQVAERLAAVKQAAMEQHHQDQPHTSGEGFRPDDQSWPPMSDHRPEPCLDGSEYQPMDQQAEPVDVAVNQGQSELSQTMIPDNLPPVQRQLMLRLQQNQKEPENKPPKVDDDNWYSSDEDESSKNKMAGSNAPPQSAHQTGPAPPPNIMDILKSITKPEEGAASNPMDRVLSLLRGAQSQKVQPGPPGGSTGFGADPLHHQAPPSQPPGPPPFHTTGGPPPANRDPRQRQQPRSNSFNQNQPFFNSSTNSQNTGFNSSTNSQNTGFNSSINSQNTGFGFNSNSDRQFSNQDTPMSPPPTTNYPLLPPLTVQEDWFVVEGMTRTPMKWKLIHVSVDLFHKPSLPQHVGPTDNRDDPRLSHYRNTAPLRASHSMNHSSSALPRIPPSTPPVQAPPMPAALLPTMAPRARMPNLPSLDGPFNPGFPPRPPVRMPERPDPRGRPDPRAQRKDPRASHAWSPKDPSVDNITADLPKSVTDPFNPQHEESESRQRPDSADDEERMSHRTDPRFKRRKLSNTADVDRDHLVQRKRTMEYNSPLSGGTKEQSSTDSYSAYNRPRPAPRAVSNKAGKDSGSPLLDDVSGSITPPLPLLEQSALDPLDPNLMLGPDTEQSGSLKDVFNQIDPAASPFC